MKTLLLLAAAAFAGLSKEERQSLLDHLTRPVARAVTIAGAGARAEHALHRDIERQLTAGLLPEPDVDLIKTDFKLHMRVNNGELSGAGGYRRYPSEHDFDLAAAKAAAEIRSYLTQFPTAKYDKRRCAHVTKILSRHAKDLPRRMPYDFRLKQVPQPPPPGPDELAFLEGPHATAQK